MTLIQISYFISICKNGSVSKAAQELHISQPAVSLALKEIEEECGAQLFIRQSNRLVLTEEGKIFNGQAQELLAHYEKMMYAIKNPSLINDTLALGVSPMNGCVVMPKILKGFNQRYPKIRLNIQENGSPGLTRMVLNGNLDVAIVSMGTSHISALEQYVIKKMKLVVSMHKKHPLARNSKLDIPMLADVPIATYFSHYVQSEMVNNIFAKYGLIPNIIYRTGQLAMLERCIKNGAAIGFLFEDIVVDLPNVVSFELDELPPGNISMIWLKNHYLSQGANKFINFVKEWYPYL